MRHDNYSPETMLVEQNVQENLASLNGFLKAFEVLNSHADNGMTFCLDQVARVGTADESVASHLQPNENYHVSIHPLEEWMGDLCNELRRWLFSNLSVSPGTETWVVELCTQQLIDAVGKEPNVFRVTITSSDKRFLRPWYGAEWTDYLFEGRNGLYLLHLGVSD